MKTCDSPLEERAIEALASGRDDLASEAEREHAQHCEACAADIVAAKALALETREQLLRVQVSPSEAQLDAWVRDATRPARAASWPPRSPAQLWAAAVAIALAAAGALTREIPNPLGGLRLLGEAGVAMVALVQVVLGLVPGGRTGVVVVGAVVLGVFALLIRRIATEGGESMLRRTFGVSFFTLASFAAAFLPSTRAFALEFQGDWDAAERQVTLTVERGVASDVLRLAAASAGVNLIATLPEDRQVTLAVKKVPLRSVIEAVLGDAAVVAKLEGDVLVIRSAEPTPTTANTTAAPIVLPPPPSHQVGDDDDDEDDDKAGPRKKKARDQVTFGDDILVREGERVKDVFTMGGDADIAGDVRGDVVTMGGEVILRRTAVVHGDLVTFGGEITVEDGAVVEGSRVGWAHGGAMASPLWKRAAEPMTAWSGWGPEWLRDLLGDVAHYALLFLFGLLLRGLAPERLSALERTLMRAPGRSLAIGVLGFAGAVVAILVLAITLIGIPAAVVVAIALPIASYLGLAAVAATLGAALPIERIRNNPIAQLACGVAILFLVSLVPFFGTIGVVVAATFGFGALLLTRFSKHAVGEQVA